MKFSLFIIAVLIIAGAIFGDRDAATGWYNKYELDVNCGEMFTGNVYERAPVSRRSYIVDYVSVKTGQPIEFPRDECVVLVKKEFYKPEKKNEHAKVKHDYTMDGNQ
jgi:hypothetical protein